METKEELLKKKNEIKKEMYKIEEQLKDKAFVASIDFASMYPSIIRLLNASIENLVGFLDNDPIAYRRLGSSKIIKESENKSKELIKTEIKDSKFVKFVGKKENKVSLRLDIYSGKYKDADIEEITETPFERYFLAILFGDDEQKFKFLDKEYTAFEFQKFLKENNYSLAGSGAVYRNYILGKDDKNKQGLIPSYLEYLFLERKKVKKIMDHHYKRKILLEKFRDAAIKDKIFKE